MDRKGRICSELLSFFLINFSRFLVSSVLFAGGHILNFETPCHIRDITRNPKKSDTTFVLAAPRFHISSRSATPPPNNPPRRNSLHFSLPHCSTLPLSLPPTTLPTSTMSSVLFAGGHILNFETPCHIRDITRNPKKSDTTFVLAAPRFHISSRSATPPPNNPPRRNSLHFSLPHCSTLPLSLPPTTLPTSTSGHILNFETP
ncbi:uncharacterized protein LOC110271468 [Arachis ipaensis]|uniref:uncharacterized protein LOC110271468 n=1 Tax=Arachis ipaensis TaxID=130454 RepID=UPI000A2B7898|nr:uncharacterized protein LOC110271468 [Arachis ipaensis]